QHTERRRTCTRVEPRWWRPRRAACLNSQRSSRRAARSERLGGGLGRTDGVAAPGRCRHSQSIAEEWMLSMSGIRKNALALMTAVCTTLFLASTPAWAQASARPDPNPGALTITGSIDFLNQYMFRGIQQNNTGFATWPAFDLGLAAYSGDGGLKSVNINFGTWNSLHTRNTGQDGPSGKLWYESDFYATLGFGFGGGNSFSTTYTAYPSRNEAFTRVKEIMSKYALDDSGYLGKAAIKPYLAIAQEFDTGPGRGQADAGAHAGTYMEIGFAPGLAVPK